MTKTLYGKVHGNTIEPDEDLGVAEGQEVEVQVRVISPKKRLPGPHRDSSLAPRERLQA